MSLLDGAFDAKSLQTALDVMLKLGLGALVGGAIGYEREVHGRPAGIRTHMLMVIGVVLFCEVSRAFAPNDPARIAAQILTGVGFLGAGTILRIGAEIKGLTSAASIWAAAALGMAVSVGGAFLWVALAGTGMCLVTLAVIDSFERKLVPSAHPRNLQVRIDATCQLGELVDSLRDAGVNVKAMRFLSRTAPMLLEIDVNGRHERAMAAITGVSGVLEASWTD